MKQLTNTWIGYNAEFSLGFLKLCGIEKNDSTIVENVMEDFAQIYGAWSEYHESYRYQKLSTAANYYGYRYPCVENCKAVLHIRNRIVEHKEYKAKRKLEEREKALAMVDPDLDVDLPFM